VLRGRHAVRKVDYIENKIKVGSKIERKRKRKEKEKENKRQKKKYRYCMCNELQDLTSSYCIQGLT
jgi:hypothetical protein